MPTMADLLKRRSSPRFTPYQQELIPYVQEAQEERKEESMQELKTKFKEEVMEYSNKIKINK